MEFEWDEEKSEANLRERGFDFSFASLIFNGFTLEQEDHRKDYGERRLVAIGIAEGIHITLVYTDRVVRGGVAVRRIISARKSYRRERKTYEEAF